MMKNVENMKNMKKTEELALKLKVTEALSKDVGRAYARMGPEDLEKLQVAIGDIVEVVGKRTTVCKAMPAYKELRGRSRMQLDGISRENAGAGIDDFVQVKKIACRPAERVVLTPITITPAETGPPVYRQPPGRPAGAGGGPHPGHPVRQPHRRFQGGSPDPPGAGADQPHHHPGDRQGRGPGNPCGRRCPTRTSAASSPNSSASGR